MLFNSFDFAVFLPVVFLLYWWGTGGRTDWQNRLLLIASYVFYGWWDWRFLSLILLSTLVDYGVGLCLHSARTAACRKWLLGISIGVNLGLLGYFKYCHFFVDNFIAAFTLFGAELHTAPWQIILPVGISFYTFQTLSYTIDVYRKRIPPTRDVIAFAAYVSFFPQLVAGPIERASRLLPQFFQRRVFRYAQAVDGLRQLLWGLFKKVVIADNCAVFVDQIFDRSADLNGSSLAIGAVLFAIQIYGDFSGYTDMAIGTARLFGFDLMRNFAYPYFARDVGEFWRRWHISLSTWFRDYLYIPLGGSRGGRWRTVRNVTIVFLVSGFWHGANWTFVVWGALHALFFLPLLLLGRNRRHLDTVAAGRWLPRPREALAMLLTFTLTTFAWIFFRATDLAQAMTFVSGLFSPSLWAVPDFTYRQQAKVLGLLILGFMWIEWVGREQAYAIQRIGQTWTRPLRWAFYSCVIFLIGMFMQTEETPFIYFQF